MTIRVTGSKPAVFLLSFALLLAGGSAWAHTDPRQAKSKAAISTEEHAFGRQGDRTKVSRTITIDMRDMMRFDPAELTIKQGQTIRFVVRNRGKVLHEMVIGTLAQLKEHAELMKKHPGMEHDEPYMSHVAAGKQQDIVWQFTQAGEFYYACLIAGHFEAGMFGKIRVTRG